ncbi:hypothetical protein PV761_03380 [Arthrobacter sp. CC3]|uniref:hypothetical protein n=1 Tax=Arthrobacter sp. CC3 TaxID=3029185 RepID=UPI0032667F9E
MSGLVDLRTVRFEIRKLQYELAELNQKIKLAPARRDMKSIRADKLTLLKTMSDRQAELIAGLESSPFSRADLADVIDNLADIESQMVHGGVEQGHGAIRAYIRWLLADAERLNAQEVAA